MDRVSSMFSNAFTSRAGQLVEKATSSNLSSEDWGLNMEICDCVNSYDDGPKDAVKAIKRRLSNNKNTNQIVYTLTVLETCVKNCGSRFHILITSKEFCNDVLLKLIHPKNGPTLALQQKILGMIQEWAETFKSTAAMHGVVAVYEELKEKGWEFPKPDQAAAAPIITPKRSVRGPPPAAAQQFFSPVPVATQGGVLPPQGNQPPRIPPGAQPSTGPIKPSEEQIAKLRAELQIVLGNVRVMSEMLTELVPEQTDASDLELLQELNRTCRAMQQRVVELVERVANEELTIELLKVNDDLNNVFLRYERFERYRTSQSGQKTTPTPAPLAAPAEVPRADAYPPVTHEEPPPSYSDTEQPTPEVNDLIDLGNDDMAPVAAPVMAPGSGATAAATNNLAALSLDQLMMTPPQPASYPTLSQDLAQFDAVGGNEPSLTEMNQTENEIEEWLKASGDETCRQQTATNGAKKDNGVTSDEFNAFLTERVMAGEQLPNISNDSSGQQSNNGDTRQRKMQTTGQPMFGL